MGVLLLLTLLQAPQPAPAKPAPAPTTQAPRPRPRPAAAASNLTLTFFVTDSTGKLLGDVAVTLTGPMNRELKTPPDSGLRITGLRPGTYQARFAREGFSAFEREIRLRGTDEIAVTLSAAPPPPPAPRAPPASSPAPVPVSVPPSSPAPTTAGKLPPAGTAKTMSLIEFLDKNFISGREGHKENIVGCSGLSQALLWQVREPWEGKQHPSADGMFFVFAGEGTIKIDGRETVLETFSFASVPRGTIYGFTRRGRNPLVVFAVLTGAPCAAE